MQRLKSGVKFITVYLVRKR